MSIFKKKQPNTELIKYLLTPGLRHIAEECSVDFIDIKVNQNVVEIMNEQWFYSFTKYYYIAMLYNRKKSKSRMAISIFPKYLFKNSVLL